MKLIGLCVLVNALLFTWTRDICAGQVLSIEAQLASPDPLIRADGCEQAGMSGCSSTGGPYDSKLIKLLNDSTIVPVETHLEFLNHSFPTTGNGFKLFSYAYASQGASVAAYAVDALACCGGSRQVIPRLVEMLDSKNEVEPYCAMQALSLSVEPEDRKLAPCFLSRLKNPVMARHAVTALCKMWEGSGEFPNEVRALLKDPDKNSDWVLVVRLGCYIDRVQVTDPAAMKFLEAARNNPEPGMRKVIDRFIDNYRARLKAKEK